MRQLYVLRGLPGSGKSTFVTESGLQAYTISPDTIRLVMGSPVLHDSGRMVMPFKDDAAVWKLLHQTLDIRMSRGELLIIDATHTLPAYFHDYDKLAQRYRYKTYAVDFADVPLKTSKERNRQREPYKVVDDAVLDKMHGRLQKISIPHQFEVLKPDEVPDTLENDITDLSNYKRVHHIGDIQGCYTPLEKYFDTFGVNDDEYYILTGDLLDRGPQNAEVLQYVCQELVGRPNVVFIEGNHDRHLWNWVTGQPVRSSEFISRTQPQLEAADIDTTKVTTLLRSMRAYFAYTHGALTVLASHGGVSTMPERLKFISADQYIKGVGNYGDIAVVDDAFMATTPDTTYQIHGHRNQQNYPLQYNDRCFNLEGKVEFGGELRAVQLSKDTFKPIEIPFR